MNRLAGALAVVLLVGGSSMAWPADNTFVVDPSSRFDVITGKAGALKFLGHEHTIRAKRFKGTIVHDPDNLEASRIELTIEVRGLEVVPQGADVKDKPAIEKEMFAEVLHPDRHPQITFVSRNAAPIEGGVRVAGDLTIEGRTNPVTVDVKLSHKGERLEAAGHFAVQQTDFGIEPYSTGAGTVKVADRITFDFAVVGVR